MEIKLKLNGRAITALVEADTVLLDFLRENACLSVKRGCDTSNCGLCTVLMDGKPILSCSTLAVRADGHEIQTRKVYGGSSDFVGFIADQVRAESGFCNSGFVMNTIALLRENPDPTDTRCAGLSQKSVRCSGYDGQLRGIRSYLNSQKHKERFWNIKNLKSSINRFAKRIG